MKLVKIIVICAAIVLLISSFSGNINHYNVFVYGLFVALLAYKLISNIYMSSKGNSLNKFYVWENISMMIALLAF